MRPFGVNTGTPRKTWMLITAGLLAVSACAPGGIDQSDNGPWAPGVDRRALAQSVPSLEVAHRLMAANQYELALEAFTRAALEEKDLTGEILSGMGSANLGLGRLGQAEDLMRRAVTEAPDWPIAWNNLGVVLMERGNIPEAQQIFRKAFALDNGESDAIRDNLQAALEKTANYGNDEGQQQEFRLIRAGQGHYELRSDQI